MHNNITQSSTRSPAQSAGRFPGGTLHPNARASAIPWVPPADLARLADLKVRVTADLASEFVGLLDRDALRRAVNEADALAATTPFPVLFLPALAEEKAHGALHWHARQREILGRSLALAV